MQRRPLILTALDLWALQQTCRDNLFYIPPGMDGQRPDSPVPLGKTLREKVNDGLIRFSDEDDLTELEIDFSDEELWLIDRALPANSYKGAQALLMQCFRCLLESRLGMRTMSQPEVKVLRIKELT